MDETQLKEFLIERVKFYWSTPKKVLLLADVPSELEHKKLNYRDILGEKRLKAFATETQGADGFKLIEHPHQKAKLGLVPYESEFEFPATVVEEPAPKRLKHLPSNTRRTTLDFLSIVNSLTEKEQSEIVIPARIVAKLLAD